MPIRKTCICGCGKNLHNKKNGHCRVFLCNCVKYEQATDVSKPMLNDGFVVVHRPIITHRPIVDELGKISCSCGSKI